MTSMTWIKMSSWRMSSFLKIQWNNFIKGTCGFFSSKMNLFQNWLLEILILYFRIIKVKIKLIWKANKILTLIIWALKNAIELYHLDNILFLMIWNRSMIKVCNHYRMIIYLIGSHSRNLKLRKLKINNIQGRKLRNFIGYFFS